MNINISTIVADTLSRVCQNGDFQRRLVLLERRSPRGKDFQLLRSLSGKHDYRVHPRRVLRSAQPQAAEESGRVSLEEHSRNHTLRVLL